MRLRIHIERTAEGRWTLSYPGTPLGAQIQIVRIARGAYPTLKRAGEVLDDEPLISLAARLAAKQPRGCDVEAFGRYLFRLLIGDALWGELAGGSPSAVELLCTDPEFAQLPWESMHGPDHFLAGDGIAVVRITPNSAPPASIKIRPRVLFAVGAELHDPRIRAGAEYFGLLRHLESTGLVMESHLLTLATRKSLEDSIGRLKPSIVHFICHGGTEPGIGGYLELISDDGSKPYDKVPARQLTKLLDPMPEVVVLNACYSGAASPDTTSLAMDILTRGAPVVIGMSGRVADRACRLFARGFYEALLTGEPVDQATAAARRIGMKHGADPHRSVDWAMPVLFLRDEVRVEIDRSETASVKNRIALARSFRQLTSPRVLCDRVGCLTHFGELLDGQEADRPRVLVLKTVDREAALKNPQYGKTRLLEEMAATAAIRGHVPCLVSFPKDEAPKTPWDLAWRIFKMIARTREEFSLSEPPHYQMFELGDHNAKPVEELSLAPLVAKELKMSQVVPRTPPEKLPSTVVRAALMADLLALAEDARAHGAAADAKPVILIDDAHLCGEGLKTLVETWANAHGLGCKDHPVPLVIAYSAVVEDIYKADVALINAFLEQRPAAFASLLLRAFPSPLEDELPYQQLFLAQSPMLVVRGDIDPERRLKFYKVLHENMYGVPSRFAARTENDAVQALIKCAWQLDVLDVADDDRVLGLEAGGVPG